MTMSKRTYIECKNAINNGIQQHHLRIPKTTWKGAAQSTTAHSWAHPLGYVYTRLALVISWPPRPIFRSPPPSDESVQRLEGIKWVKFLTPRAKCSNSGFANYFGGGRQLPVAQLVTTSYLMGYLLACYSKFRVSPDPAYWVLVNR